MIKLIAGLGNPGTQYELTRHNLGTRIVTALFGVGEYGRWQIWKGHQLAKDSQKPLLFISSDFMNISGQSIAECVRFHKIEPSELVVVHDDLDLPLGDIQMKFGGSSGGHNGIESVIESLGTPDFWRLRVGIGRPTIDAAAYVLERFTDDEEKHLPKIVDQAVLYLLQSMTKSPENITIHVK